MDVILKSLYDSKITSVEFPSLHVIKIVLDNNSVFVADLSDDFRDLAFFPKSFDDWKLGKIGVGRFSIEWPTGFDVHFDHIVELSSSQNLSA